jgi:hypothetical protein
MAPRTWTAGLVYLLAACVFTWPLILHPRSLLGADDPTGDPSLYLWVLGWDLRSLFEHPGWLLTGRVFDANIYHPAPNTLAYSDHLLPQALVLAPLYALTRDLVLCYNVLLLGSLIASALAMHLLVRTLVESERPAYVAGLVFGFAPYHFAHLTHIQLQSLYFLPLSFLFLHRVFAASRRRDAVALGVVLGLQTASSIYYGIIGGIGVGGFAITLAMLTGRLRDWRLMRRGVLAGAVALLVLMPWSISYLQVRRETGAGRNLSEAARGGAVLASYLQAPSTNLLYGRTGWLRPGATARLPRKDGPEQDLFPGFCALLLAAVGAIAAPRGLRRVAAAYAVLVAAGVVLSLGPDGVRPLYTALYNVVFGLAAIRASARFSVLALFAVAVLSAVGARAIETRRSRSGPLIGLAILIIALEYGNGTINYPAAPQLTSNAGRWIRDQPGTGAVICLPMNVFAGNTACMLQSLEHGRPVVNGYSGVRPLFFEALVDAMSGAPNPESLLAMHDLGVEYVVSDRPLAIEAGLEGALVERASFSDQHVYRVQWSPTIESALRAASEVLPPAPGPAPFASGESATYRVWWAGGPLNLPAGDATIAVAPPRASESFRFVVSAGTAPWVSRFYKVTATLETTATDRLLPLEYRETIDEGTRRIDRHVDFDSARREVRITSGGTSITLPLGAESRDPLSALFYLRTLPLGEGARFLVPISDNGRRMSLEVSKTRPETVVVNGQPWPALKLEPRLSERIDRGPLTVTAWISADERRIPLLVEVSAGFGSVRLELVDYRGR